VEDRENRSFGQFPSCKGFYTMSTRERWIVYPLLFLTLGIALRDKVVPPSQIRCNELQAGQVVCNRLESVQSECRTLLVHGPNGRPVVVAGADNASRAGTIETFTVNGLPQIQLHSTEHGGMITTIGHAGKLILALGDMGQSFGLLAQLPDLRQIIPLAVFPWKFDAKPSNSVPPKTPPPPDKPPQTH
jgi:hypothetical protein